VTPNHLLTDIKVIDADTHVIEPADLWTSRVSVEKWGDLVPHVRWDKTANEEAWYFGDRRVAATAQWAISGWHQHPPLHAPSLSEIAPETKDPSARAAWMDLHGIHAQVLYPNVAGFGTGQYLSLHDRDLMLECVRAYNDFLIDFSSNEPGRFIPVMAVPFWDLEATKAEIQRGAELGHKGIMFGSEPENWGCPSLWDRHWDPVWAIAQEAELPINFHIASGSLGARGDFVPENGLHASYASNGVVFFLGNARAIARIITGGICHRFPKLEFVSVESGIGWLPYLLSALDWSWKNYGVPEEHSEYQLLPSEYFRRQVYGCFWFETDTALTAIEQLGADNVLYETDFPHPGAMAPGPASAAISPRQFIETTLRELPTETLRKVLHDNAARLYKVQQS
jgi:predicted TIM-barrel fold metal-dependent hydrolase